MVVLGNRASTVVQLNVRTDDSHLVRRRKNVVVHKLVNIDQPVSYRTNQPGALI